jgi:hypothetical protein
VPQQPDFGALGDEDARRIKAIEGLTFANRGWLARNYATWLQLLWFEGAKQRAMAGAPSVVAIESLPGNDIRRQVVLAWADGAGERRPFGSIWVDASRDEMAVMYQFHGSGYTTEIRVAARASK